MSLTDAVEDHLFLWVLLAVALGFLYPPIAVLTRVSTLILAVMIGSISLTLSVERFESVDPGALALVLGGHVAMPFIAYAIASVLGLPPELTVGFVVLGAVTPELVTPVMTELAGGDTALSSAALVVIGVGSLAFVPAVAALLGGGADLPTRPIVEGLAVAVVAPMALAMSARARRPTLVGAYDDYYPAVSAAMVVLIIGGVTAANASVVRANVPILVSVATGAVALNALGYGLGFAVSRGRSRPTRIASVLSVGMRDFAVAAALVVAAGLPTVASLPAV
ncbi:MAG: bile acid:sodium symporter family protein, partial [Halobellus sp.]